MPTPHPLLPNNLLTIDSKATVRGPDGQYHTVPEVIKKIQALEHKKWQIDNAINSYRHAVRTTIRDEADKLMEMFPDNGSPPAPNSDCFNG